jgi:HlyD family secretion protein
VAPEIEQVISSPLNTRIIKILKRPGDLLTRGEAILQLDVTESQLALEKINQQIELKINQQLRAKLELDNTLNNLQSQYQIKNLEHKSFQNISSRNRELKQNGLLSVELLQQAELNEEKALFELKQIEAAKNNAQQSTKAQLDGLLLELHTLENERSEAARQLELATTKSDRDGVLTFVVSEEGATVQKGAVIARIADLRSFRVDATTSEIHARRLSTNLPVVVKIDEDYLNGRLANILPTIKDGVITIQIELLEKTSPLLRANLRVDTFIQTERKQNVLRIKKGPFINSEGIHNVYVVRGDVAIKTPIQIGIASQDYYEVIEGLLEGDEVIISEMTDYMHLKEVKLK